MGGARRRVRSEVRGRAGRGDGGGTDLCAVPGEGAGGHGEDAAQEVAELGCGRVWELVRGRRGVRVPGVCEDVLAEEGGLLEDVEGDAEQETLDLMRWGVKHG